MSIHFALLLLQSGGLGALGGLIPLVMMLVLFYVLIIVPQRRQQRKVQEMLNNLKPGDKVVTNGGIYGTITIVRDDKRTIQLKIADSPVVKVDIARSAVSGLQGTEEEKK
ncbi:MAG: preprotein translocase subunit YajC [Acidobacteria bacterium]|jgi:preprotein translocase subunit YajC|nr:preprotein translocase subunit YajC [Acidobacteriota bacterium]MCW5967775.1 preprotein translocase subunit YajC [Blastocatellales bacterium]